MKTPTERRIQAEKALVAALQKKRRDLREVTEALSSVFSTAEAELKAGARNARPHNHRGFSERHQTFFDGVCMHVLDLINGKFSAEVIYHYILLAAEDFGLRLSETSSALAA